MPTALIVPEMMREVDGPYVKILRDAGFDVRYPQDPQLARNSAPEADRIAELSVADATIASTELYTPSVLAGLSKLRVIARCGVGYDRVDIPSATEHNIPVTITPTANHEAVAEQALALLFAVAKSVVPYDRAVRQGEWPRTPPRPLRGKTMGVFGLGRIGRSFAKRCLALGMNVIATEKFPQQDFVTEHQIELVDFDALLARSDYISIHCPLGDETRGIFNQAAFAKMKPGSVLLNTSRGPVVVEADLHAALTSGHLGGAGLDVFEQEPPSADNPLFKLDQVTVSPHVAGVDQASIEAMGVEAAECIVALYKGQWPDGKVVNDDLKGRFQWGSDSLI